jgi:Na+(H+)/acetate symporter ActP
VVAVVVTLNVFLGGMRGTVWVNILQTIMFLCFGAVAVAWISHALPHDFSIITWTNWPRTRKRGFWSRAKNAAAGLSGATR